MAVDRRSTVIAAIEHKVTPLCPYVISWEGDIDQRLDAYYKTLEWRSRFRNYIQICAEADDGAFQEGHDHVRDLFGSLWRTDQRPIHLADPILKKRSLRGFRFPEPELFFPVKWQASFRRRISQYSDCFTVGMLGFGLFERCWTLRGFENTLVDIAEAPAFFRNLINAVADHQLELLDRLLSLPLDGILLGDDWGDQRGIIVGPERWRELIKEPTARLYARVKKAGRFVIHHSCGSVAEIVPDLINMGLDVLESVQPEAKGMVPYELKAAFGDRLAFWGGLGSQSTIPFSTPERLRAEIRRLVDRMSESGGYILAGSKGLQPGTPVENAAALLEEFIAVGEP